MMVRECDGIFGILRIPGKKIKLSSPRTTNNQPFWNFIVIQQHKSLVQQACYTQTKVVHQAPKTTGIDRVTNVRDGAQIIVLPSLIVKTE